MVWVQPENWLHKSCTFTMLFLVKHHSSAWLGWKTSRGFAVMHPPTEMRGWIPSVSTYLLQIFRLNGLKLNKITLRVPWACPYHARMGHGLCQQPNTGFRNYWIFETGVCQHYNNWFIFPRHSCFKGQHLIQTWQTSSCWVCTRTLAMLTGTKGSNISSCLITLDTDL